MFKGYSVFGHIVLYNLNYSGTFQYCLILVIPELFTSQTRSNFRTNQNCTILVLPDFIEYAFLAHIFIPELSSITIRVRTRIV